MPQLTVLLVDDEPLMLASYQRALAQLDVNVVPSEHAEQALEILRTRSVDVVVSDFRMPGMKGDAFLAEVRNRWPLCVRVLVTGQRDMSIVEQAVRRGAIYRFLAKPCDPQDFVDAVRDALAESQLVVERERRAKRRDLDLQTYQHLFRSASLPIMIADLDGFIFEANGAFVRQTGDGREDALRARPHIVTRRGSDVEWQDIYSALMDRGSWTGEVERDERIFALNISGIRNENNEYYACVAMEQDITARRRFEQQQRAAQYEVILALAKLAEFRDPETGAHLERMRRYSRILAAELCSSQQHRDTIDEAYVEAVFYASPLHDIGKVGVPDRVLLKPGKLDEDEWVLMKQHPQIGAQVLDVAGATLSERGWLSMARVIALQHHEKVDGSGYPHGLAGDDIELCARIVALADAYDAITSKRVYKDALSHERARGIICEAAGSQFDSDVVAAFVVAQEQFVEVARRYRGRCEFLSAPDDVRRQTP